MSEEADKLEGITMEEWYSGFAKIESTDPAVNHGLGRYVCNDRRPAVKFYWDAPEVIVNGR